MNTNGDLENLWDTFRHTDNDRIIKLWLDILLYFQHAFLRSWPVKVETTLNMLNWCPRQKAHGLFSSLPQGAWMAGCYLKMVAQCWPAVCRAGLKLTRYWFIWLKQYWRQNAQTSENIPTLHQYFVWASFFLWETHLGMIYSSNKCKTYFPNRLISLVKHHRRSLRINFYYSKSGLKQTLCKDTAFRLCRAVFCSAKPKGSNCLLLYFALARQNACIDVIINDCDERIECIWNMQTLFSDNAVLLCVMMSHYVSEWSKLDPSRHKTLNPTLNQHWFNVVCLPGTTLFWTISFVFLLSLAAHSFIKKCDNTFTFRYVNQAKSLFKLAGHFTFSWSTW